MTEIRVPIDAKLVELLQNQVEFAKKVMDRELSGADGFLMTFHVVKNQRIVSSRVFENWPIGDWGTAMIYLGCEAKAAKLLAESGGA